MKKVTEPEYTPTTEQVRSTYCEDVPSAAVEFNRWLDGVKISVAHRVLDEVARMAEGNYLESLIRNTHRYAGVKRENCEELHDYVNDVLAEAKKSAEEIVRGWSENGE